MIEKGGEKRVIEDKVRSGEEGVIDDVQRGAEKRAIENEEGMERRGQ